ncbi:MAG TPA: MBL fold metallo-hydrolase [Candidatus Limnocylindrales bacterium]|nr:MBL fold metallo-hydrolase [Candidatus Limnocylindrales bacterium]
MDVETFVTLGLGDNSFLVASGDEAVLIDPQRDAWRFLEAAERRGWHIRHVLETHVHNDYVSGALEARSVTGAEIVVHADAGPYGFPHRAIEPGDDVRIGDVRLVARAAPGHTFEHLAWEALVPGRPEPTAVFTGGSLLVGSAGRSDLLGDDLAEQLARLQYRTVHDLAKLPADTRVMPTHGAGSFCVSTAPSADRVSTIGAELATNVALLAEDEDVFVRQQLASLGRYPAYYPRMAPINRAGPPILGRLPGLPALSPDEAIALSTQGAWVIDGRDRSEFAAGHVPGSINIELDDAFGTYVGWIVPFGAPLVLVLPDPLEESASYATAQLVRIGWDVPAGYVAGGVEAWLASGRPTRSYPVAAMRELFERRVRDGEDLRVLDVRQPAEWRDDGAIPDSLQMFVADVPARIGELPRDAELWVVCTTGHRATIAASLLDRAGVPVRLVARGGTVGWIERFVEPATAGLRTA